MIRNPVVAGQFYPQSPTELEAMIEGFIDENVEKEDVIGLVSPHAGYVYSGQTAAYDYKQLEGLDFDIVAIVSPMHRMYVGPVIVNDCDHCETPLGLVKVDRGLVTALEKRISLSRVDWDDEHSLEIQLPFLQHVLGDFELLPVMQGDQSLSTCQALADALVAVLQGKRALLIASTDLSHFHSYDAAVKLDSVASQAITDYDLIALSTRAGG